MFTPTMLRLSQIFISPGHNYFGRYGKQADRHPILELAEVECVAGMGLKGDRFFGYRPDYRGQVTLFSADVFDSLREKFGLPTLSPAVLRRNLLIEGGDLNALIGTTFQLQDVSLKATEECRPCFWMNQAVAPGAEDWLKGRGGLRCQVLVGGVLRCADHD